MVCYVKLLRPTYNVLTLSATRNTAERSDGWFAAETSYWSTIVSFYLVPFRVI